MEFPTNIRFDFLVFLLGLVLVISPFYFHQEKNLVLTTLMLMIGGLLLMLGVSFIKYDYDLDFELKELEYAKRKKEYTEFFEGKNLLTKKSKEKHENDIKDIIN